MTSEEKCRYVRLKLDGKAYYWWRDNHRFCGQWFVLQNLLRTRYLSHLLYIYEVDYNEPDAEPETEPDLKVVDKSVSEPKVKEFLIEYHVELPAEPAMELSPSSPAMRVPLSLRSPDVYHPLQNFYT